jgi:hypothetical protein
MFQLKSIGFMFPHELSKKHPVSSTFPSFSHELSINHPCSTSCSIIFPGVFMVFLFKDGGFPTLPARMASMALLFAMHSPFGQKSWDFSSKTW